MSEKICLQEGGQPKAFRPSRLMRGRLQRPKPNIGKATERKEIPASQEKIRATEEKNENDAFIDRDVSTIDSSQFFIKQIHKLCFNPFCKYS